MKKKLLHRLSKAGAIFTAFVLLAVQLFLMPAVQAVDAQISPTQKIQKPSVLSRLHIITPARSTLLVEDGKQEALLINDNLASTRIIEKIDGTSVVSQRYFPYGQTQDQENTITDKQFTGHRNIAESGVYHAGARFYAPQMGLFVQADKVQGPNRYAYVNGNPISNTDPTGNVVCNYCKDLSGFSDENEGRFPDRPAPISGVGSLLKANLANLFTSIGVMKFLPRSSLDQYVSNNDVNTGYVLATSPAAGMIGYKGRGASVDDFVTIVSETYRSGAGDQLIKFKQGDSHLARFLDDLDSYVARKRTSPKMSRAPIVEDFVGENIRYSIDAQQDIYRRNGGIANLGDFCASGVGVCREMAAMNHVGLASQGKESWVAVANILGSRHVWAEFIDSVTGKWMVSDTAYVRPTYRSGVIERTKAYELYGPIDDLARYQLVIPKDR